ncbi:alcohol dehydrogenase catalytic domain-containing protein [Anoxynatronum buryatiense]|uniref:L-gulonate 5-dehydrogenase n=1 Tax=Anoxynatronum buryatiense TaxID=489973 RepID=A0AA45WWJ0_9CLOT|nr:alcohol dehydrogenase catalytic domain-containing protein [Anoxynatronum buryatiense]SMP59049.1 L-gulonate 5-dehydrogenase [Anoxynatronum buryatiense]
MKAAIVRKPNQLEMVDMENPRITDEHQVLVQVKAAGICGSDVHIYHGTSPVATYPRILGHEIVGVVKETGSKVDRVKVGDRIILDQVMPCGTCYACSINRGNVCHNLKVRGVHEHGGYREYLVADQKDCYRLPATISFVDAVMIEPATIAVQSLHRAELRDGDVLLILGAGALGSSILNVAKRFNSTIIAADVSEERLSEALAKGAHFAVNMTDQNPARLIRDITGGYGPTVSIDAACTKDTLPFLLDVTGNAGRVITMGFLEEPSPVSQLKITAKELDVRGSRLQNKRFQEVLDLIDDGLLDLTGAVSHTFDFSDIQEAFRLIEKRDPTVKKIVITF